MAFPRLTTNIWCDIIFKDSCEGVASMAFAMWWINIPVFTWFTFICETHVGASYA